MNFSIIAAMHHSNRAIGTTDNKIPWSCPEDMRFFRKLTMHTEDPAKTNAVIMGSNTWKSLGCKPLPNRLNIVLSRNSALQNVMVCSSLDEALHRLDSMPLIERAFVIGGQNVYEQALEHPSCVCIYLNKILVPINEGAECTTFFPTIDYNKYELLESVAHESLALVKQKYVRK